MVMHGSWTNFVRIFMKQPSWDVMG